MKEQYPMFPLISLFPLISVLPLLVKKRVGGLVGDNSGTIQNSRATESVNGGNGNDDVGGLVGYASNSVRNSYVANSVNGGGGNDQVGGLVGSSLGVNNSYATGYVRGGSGDDKVGGLAGVGSVTNSYSIATVDGGNGTDTVSHLVASVSGTSTVTDSYYDNDSSKLMGGTVKTFGTGKTSAELKELTGTNTSWSTNDWNFGSTSQYPSLKSYREGTDASGSPIQVLGYLLCGQHVDGFVQCMPDADGDGDGVADTTDVDDDNDGLIEIATAGELYNIRYQLDGTSYKTSTNDTGSVAGCSTTDPVGCNGYELDNNIDLSSIANFAPLVAIAILLPLS